MFDRSVLCGTRARKKQDFKVGKCIDKERNYTPREQDILKDPCRIGPERHGKLGDGDWCIAVNEACKGQFLADSGGSYYGQYFAQCELCQGKKGGEHSRQVQINPDCPQSW